VHNFAGYITLVLIQRSASDKEKVFFKSEFAMAQEELERQKKEIRNAKKVGYLHYAFQN